MTVWSKEIFAKNLKRYISITGKTQSEIISDLNLKQSTFNEWVNAKKYPRIDKIEMLADYFGILKSDLIEEKKIGDMPEEADFHAKILTDKDLMNAIEEYYILNRREQEIVRNFIHSLTVKD